MAITRKYTNFLFLMLIVALLLPACKGARSAADGDAKMRSADAILKRMVKQQVRAKGMESRARISIDDGSFSQSATANIKWLKDSLIWMNVTKFGFEVARAQITQDSVYLIDRLNNEYAIKDLSFVQDEYNLPANFATLEAMLIGNPVFFGKTTSLVLKTAENEYILAEKNLANSINSSYVIDAQEFLLKSMFFEELAEQQKMRVLLDDYRQVSGNQNFSYLRKVEVNSPKTGTVDIGIEFSKVELTPPSRIRFEIPSRYTRID